MARREAEPDDRPYWLWHAMLERVAVADCERGDGSDPCEYTGMCITEWCLPCAAKAFLKDAKEASDADKA